MNKLLNFHMFAHAHYTKFSHVYTKNGKIKVWVYTIIRLSLNDTGVSQQMAFISGPSLHQLSKDIFEILLDLTVAEIKW